MKTKTLPNKPYRYASLFGCLLLLTTSCVDSEYDLNNKLNTEVSILGDITLPIGTSTPVLLSELIDTADIEMLYLNGNNYSISIDDSQEVTIDALSDDGKGISINGINFEKEIDEEVSADTDLPSFTINTGNSLSINPNLTRVTTSTIESSIGKVVAVTPNYPSEITAIATNPTSGIPVSNLKLPLTVDPFSIDINIDPATECPDVVTSISDIKFGEAGIVTTITLDITPLSNGFNNFTWNSPEISLTFPDGFVLSNGTNVLTVSTEQVVGNTFDIDVNIMSYNKTLEPVNGKLPAITGEIACTVSNKIDLVSATSNGNSINLTDNFNLTIGSSEMAISDMSLAVSGIEIKVSDMVINSTIEIKEVPSDIKYVNSITFVDGTNFLNIDIEKIYLPGNLSIEEGTSFYLNFPEEIFDLTKNSLPIATSDLDGTGTYSDNLNIYGIKLGENYPNTNGTITFNPEITLVGTTINVSGDLLLSEYNDYVDNNQNQEIGVNAISSELEVDETEVFTETITITLDDQTSDFNINQEVDGIKKIHSLDFESDVTAVMYIEIEGLPVGEDTGDISFSDYTIEFPKFIVFDSSAGVDSDNKITLNSSIGNTIDETRIFTKTFKITGFDFTDSSYDGITSPNSNGVSCLVLDESIYLSGNLSLSEGKIDSNISNITGVVKFTIPDITVTTATVEIDADVPEVYENMDLSDMTAELDVNAESIVLSNPTITMDIANTLAAPLEIQKFSLTPYKNSVASSVIELTDIIDINAAVVNGEPTTTSISISAEQTSGDNCYYLPGLKNLLDGMPSSIDIEVVAGVADGVHTVDLTQSYYVNIDYAVNVPLEFEEILINFADTITDLAETLVDITDMVSSLELILNLENTLPFTVSITEITPIDADGNVLSLSDIVPDSKTIGGSLDGSVVESEITLSLADNDKEDLKKLDGLIISIDASITSTNGGVALETDQYIQFGLKVRLPEGLSFDLDGDSDEE